MASLNDRLKEIDQLKKNGTISDEEYHARRALILGDTSPAPAKRRGGVFRWGLIGCGGMLAAIGLLVVIIVVVAVAAVGSSASNHKDTHVAYANRSSGTVTTAGNVTPLQSRKLQTRRSPRISSSNPRRASAT